MSYAVMPLADYIDACNAVREKTGDGDLIESGELAAKVQLVYEAGKSQSGEYERGFDDGRQAEYDSFWDSFQENGSRVNYHYAFYRPWWNDSTFKPKYSMQPTNAGYMFYVSGITDLKAICEEQGITIDFSNATNADMLFHSSKVTNVGVVDLSGVTSANQVFYQCENLENVDLVVSNSRINWFHGVYGCTNLKNIRFSGVIGERFYISGSKELSKASIISIINCLSDTTSSITVQFSKTAVSNAFETAEGLADGSESEEWLNLIATKPNWTISLQ